MHFLSEELFQRTYGQFWNELLKHQLLPRRYHAWYSRKGERSGDENDDGLSLPLNYNQLVQRYPHIEKDHLVKLLKQLVLGMTSPLYGVSRRSIPNSVGVSTLLGSGSFSLLGSDRNREEEKISHEPTYLRWPHVHANQVRGLCLREIGGGFRKHHRAPSIRAACYAIAKPSFMMQKMQNIKKLRGHSNAVYCAILDCTGRFVITGSDDRLVKIWSMETAFCLASCRGHEGDITDLSVSSNNAVVASASNDCIIRVWRLPDGLPISVLRGHTGAVTAIAFSPRPSTSYHLLSSSDDGTCRIWDARYTHVNPRIYLPKPSDDFTGMTNGPSSSIGTPSPQMLCCAYNADGTVFVAGSSDTFARVWSACKSSTQDSEKPNHEIDILSGHENDVNYVQFSGCASVSRYSTIDTSKEENIPKFKYSWFTHDNIVTCSVDGSAIIWIPRSRRSHGKVERWTRAYHLKVPTPPMTSEPLRGGPRQRFRPTPRGVNMIVWSLDNRFVLATIMDCRICVWNAVDGSLVHSLTGHTESTYVLDVHPFNPRMAMSAGYDGRTIVWDIWEGTPIRIYEIGRFKLVDGKFSPDGTSIILSDDVGQIYIISTGQGESQKDAKYDQFFLGDYRPLTRDTYGNVMDQETQLAPYRRNIQDLLCDSSMIPYPEPYQGMYQHQRSRALGIERRPSSVTFAIGPGEISGIQDYSMVPLLDLDITVDPLSEFVEAIDWEAENEVQSDDSDSEYNVTDEYSSEGERGSLGLTFGDIDCSEEYSEVEHSQKDSLRRSKRKNSKVEFLTSSRKCGKRKDLDECGGAFPRIYRTKKLKNGQKAYGKRCTTSKSSRPRRISARNALNSFSKCTEASSGEEDKGSSESDSSNNEKMLSDSNTPNVVPVKCKHSEQENLRNRRRLVLKSQFCDSDKSTPPVNIRSEGQKLVNFVGSYIVDAPETSIERDIDLNSQERGTSSGNSGEVIASQNYKRNIVRAIEQSEMVNDLNKIRWGEVKPRTSKRLRCEDATVGHQVSNASLHHRNGVRNNVNGRLKFGNDYGVANTPKTPNQREVKSLLTVDEDIDKSVCTRSNSHSVRTNSGNDDDAMEESTSHDIKIDRINFPEAMANGIRKTRSIRTKAARRELLCEDWRSNSKITLGLRSTRNRREIYYGTVLSPVDTRKSHQSLRKLSWLTLSEHEDNCRYIPQLGDYVVYLRQGHEGYINWCHLSEVGPWISLKGNLRAMELCKVEGLDYSTVPGSGDSCCKIKLELVDPCSSLVGKAFKLTLPELTNFSDFLVERTRFDVAVKRNWTLRDRCQVWWRNEHAEGGIWWEGRIVSVKPLSLEFPESPWERYTIQYKSDGVEHQHSPWELHDHDIKWKHPRISDDIKYRLLTSFSDLERHGYINKDCYGLQKLQQVSQKSNFLNRFPVPVSLDLIKERLQNDYYRSLEALKHDFVVMHSNGSSYFGKNAELAMKMERLSDWFYRELVPL